MRALTGLLVCGLALSSRAFAGGPPTDFTWTGSSDGTHWNNPGNWTPSGVPGDNFDDTATIPPSFAGTVLVSTDGVTLRGVTLNSGTLSDSLTIAGTLTGAGFFNWGGGTISAVVTLDGGAKMTVSGTTVLDDGAIANHGTILWTGGSIEGDDGAKIFNFGVFEDDAPDGLILNTSDEATFVNELGSTFQIDVSGTLVFPEGWTFLSYGNLQLGACSLYLESDEENELGDHTNIVSGRLVLGEFHPAMLPFSIADGTVYVDGGATLEIGDNITLNLFTPDGGGFQHAWVFVDGPGTLAWTSGQIAGNSDDSAIIASPETSVVINGSDTKLLTAGANFSNQGVATWIGTGQLTLDFSTFENSGVFLAEQSAAISTISGGLFTNSGLFVNSPDGGDTMVEDEFDNSGAVLLLRGGLVFDQAATWTFIQDGGALILDGGTLVAYDTHPGSPAAVLVLGGEVSGSGTIDAQLENAGILRPGGAGELGAITVTSDYQQDPSGVLEIDIAGAGANDLLTVGGNASLSGNVSVNTGAFVPSAEETFTPMTYTSKSDAFTSLTTNGPAFTRTYLSTAFELVAVGPPTDAGSVTDAGSGTDGGFGPGVDAGSDAGQGTTDAGHSGADGGGNGSTSPTTSGCACSGSAGALSLLAMIAAAFALRRPRVS